MVLQVNKQDKWLHGFTGCSITDKESGVNFYIRYMLNRMQSAFRWEGLPDTIPQRMLELYLQANGNCFVTEHNGNLYAFTGGLGGTPDEYYRPTLYTVANPALQISTSYNIKNDGVLVLGDSMLTGLLPMFHRYAQQIVENDITIRMADINIRLQSMITAPSDAVMTAAKEYLKQLEDGKTGVVLDDDFKERIAVHSANVGSGNYLTQLIELQQYLKASWYNDIGIDANFNMKREVLNDGETEQNQSALLPLVDDMLRCRREAANAINEKYNTNISVALASAWEKQRVGITEQDVEVVEDEKTD